MMKQIFVIGSINVDILMVSKKLPKIGETIKADNFYIYPGGKGANQAVASSRIGSKTTLIGKIGNDYFGDFITTYLKKENIQSQIKYGNKTGIALINTEMSGKNMISVFAGANSELNINDLKNVEISDSIVLFQQEIPLKTIEDEIRILKNGHNIIIIDPSPVTEVNEYILKNSDYITPNETEASKLSGIKIKSIGDAKEASEILYGKYGNNIIIKLGERGSIINVKNNIEYFKPYKLIPVDTTGAGDCFNGAFASHLLSTGNVGESMEFANVSAAISTTGYGAFPSFPYLNEVLEKFKNR